MNELKYVKFHLLDFQEREVKRLYTQPSRLVAWEMGTGKTYAGIALDQENRGRSKERSMKQMGEVGAPRKTLIVCPKSVLGVWDQHTMDLTDEDVYVIDTKNRAQFVKDILNPNRGGYFIIHWAGVRILRNELSKVPFFHIIADECHRAKNRKAQQTLALKALKTLYKTALSGTPADNKPHDLWSILNWLWPKVYTSYWNFFKAYIVSEMTPEGYSKVRGVKKENIPHLRKQMAPWYSRLLKKDVLKDLPDKYYSTLWVDMGPEQKRAYKEMQNTMVAWVKDHQKELEQENPIIAQAVVAQLVRLQQFAIAYVIPDLDANGIQKTKKVKKTDKSTGETYYVERLLFTVTDPSSKLDALMEMLEDNPEEQIVVFSQFKAVINLLGKRLTEKGISHGLFTGDTSAGDRTEIVRKFQAGELSVFAGTLAAGGEGITLTNATTVVLLDRAWSPAINAQAEDRLHRIGQKSAVHVIDFMAKGTVDIGRKEMLEQKMGWLREILGDQADTVSKFMYKKGMLSDDDGA